MTSRGFKFIQSDMTSKNGHDDFWVLGEWKKHEGELVMCKKGYHYCKDAPDSLQYVYGDRWFIVEAKGGQQTEGNKTVASEMRLVKEIPTKVVAVRFALACAGRVLDKFEAKYPKDDRPRKAIEAADKWVQNPSEENRSAASAAWSAASAAESAAESAARSAAESAASAAWSAAESAARSAARSAAESAASAAWSAAWSAASAASAARSAAESAAWSAELKWQRNKLARIIEEEESE